MSWQITSEPQRDNLINALREMKIGEWGFFVEIKIGTRTLKQNAAMYVYFALLATALNDAGYECVVKITGDVEVEIPWTADLVKRLLWHPIMQKMFRIKSTAKLKRDQVSEIYEALNRFTGGRMGVYVPFPEKNYGDIGY